MRLRHFVALLGCLAWFALLGCGVTPTGSGGTSTASAASALAGNWLLGGTLPTNSLGSAPGAVVSIDVTGQTVTATGFFGVSCTNLSLSVEYGIVVTGTLQADGTFNLAFPAALANSPQVTLAGKAPSSAGAPWSGSYTVSQVGLTGCTTAQLTSNFTATAMGDYTGVYTGSGTFLQIPGSQSSGPITLAVTLKQGATIGKSSTTSRLGLSGSFAVTGIPCFTRSTGASATGGSLVEGNRALLSLATDDGSTVALLLQAQNVSLSQLAVEAMIVQSGQCAGNYLTFQTPLILTRQ